MTENLIGSMISSDLGSAIPETTVDTKNIDGIQDQKETTWVVEDFEQNLGYYKEISELRAVIDVKARWTIGLGVQADEITTMLLDTIKGNGFDTFNTILENMIRTMNISGDSYAEIIRDDEENLVNLKPLDPSQMRMVFDRKGIILRYEKIKKTGEKVKTETKFQPDEILHLSRNRIADEIHGVSMIESLTWIIIAKKEAQENMKLIIQRFAKPQWKFKLKTDDPTEIAAYKAKQDAATGSGNNIYEPFDVSESELVAVAPNSTLNVLPWLTWLDDQFYLVSGVPKIILGGTGAITEAAVKIAYLAYEQTIKEEQLQIEEIILSQLNIEIKLEIPASLQNELLSDEKKDGAESAAPQAINPSETTAGEGQ